MRKSGKVLVLLASMSAMLLSFTSCGSSSFKGKYVNDTYPYPGTVKLPSGDGFDAGGDMSCYSDKRANVYSYESDCGDFGYYYKAELDMYSKDPYDNTYTVTMTNNKGNRFVGWGTKNGNKIRIINTAYKKQD